MSMYAKVLEDGRIDYITSADRDGLLVVPDDVTILHRYIEGVWVLLPEDVEAAKPPRQTTGTFMEFKAILTEEEDDAITGAAMTLLPIKKWYDLAVATNSIDLTNPTVIAGMQVFVDNNLMTDERKTEILAHGFGVSS